MNTSDCKIEKEIKKTQRESEKSAWTNRDHFIFSHDTPVDFMDSYRKSKT